MLLRALTFALLAAGIYTVVPTAHAASCTLRSRAVAFGNYDPLRGAPHNRTTRILRVRCTGNGTLTVALSTGKSNSYTPRYMISATSSDQLDYNLYTNPAHSSIWGDGTGGSQTVSRAFNNNTVNLFAYGQIAALQDVAPGRYTDHITATVSF